MSKKLEITTIESAIKLALDAHAGQTDKGGAPYILHPLRVFFRLGACSAEVAIAAILHDVFEDTTVIFPDVVMPIKTARILKILTRKGGEDYATYISRVMLCKHAARIKEMDLLENLDGSRLLVRGTFPERNDKYLRALRDIQESLGRFDCE